MVPLAVMLRKVLQGCRQTNAPKVQKVNRSFPIRTFFSLPVKVKVGEGLGENVAGRGRGAGPRGPRTGPRVPPGGDMVTGIARGR